MIQLACLKRMGTYCILDCRMFCGCVKLTFVVVECCTQGVGETGKTCIVGKARVCVMQWQEYDTSTARCLPCLLETSLLLFKQVVYGFSFNVIGRTCLTISPHEFTHLSRQEYSSHIDMIMRCQRHQFLPLTRYLASFTDNVLGHAHGINQMRLG